MRRSSADNSIAFTFTAGVAGHRVLPEAAYGNGQLTYSISPAPANGVTFAPGPPARIGVSETSVASVETTYILTATDDDGDTDTMKVIITVIEDVCPNSAAVSGYTDPGIVRDCEVLLVSRDVLSRDQPLNWSVDLSIQQLAGNRDCRQPGCGNGFVPLLGLSGTIPSELGNLSSLQRLRLSQNGLTGPVPPELGGLANLRDLFLDGNQLTGEIPSEVGNLINLQSLNFGVNQLIGPIPGELGESRQPAQPGTLPHPIDRGNTGLFRKPHQPTPAGSRWQPVDRENTSLFGRPRQPTRLGTQGQSTDRRGTRLVQQA